MTLSLLRRLLLSSLHVDLAYRASVVFMLLGQVLWIGIFTGTYALIYTQVQSLVGYSFDESMIYYATFMLLVQLLDALFLRAMQALPDLIHRGRLDTVLTKPVDAQLLVLFSRISLLDFVKLIPPAILLAVFLARAPQAFSWWYLPMLLVAIVGCTALWSLMMSVAFVASRIGPLSEMFATSMRMLQFPPQMYRGVVKILLYVLFPIAPLVLLPVQSLLSPALLARSVVVGLALSGILVILARLAWNAGLRRYVSAS